MSEMKKEEGLFYKIMITTLKRIIRSGWKNSFRNGASVIATIFIIVITISLISSLFLLNLSSQFLASSLQDKIDIAVYFKEDVLLEEILQVKLDIVKIPEVKDVEYISKEEALEKFIERHKKDQTLMDSLSEVGGNPFLASLNITARQMSQYDLISAYLDNSSFRSLFNKIDYYQRKTIIQKIDSITSSVNKTGIVLSFGLGLLAVLVTFNTIRLAIYNAREEIATMRLVGASNWFIRGPFVVEGVLSGLAAALICAVSIPFILYFLSPKTESLLPGLNLFGFWVDNILKILALQFLTGIALGSFSSMIAIRRYLRI